MPQAVVIATCREYPGLLDDDRPFVAHLLRRGVSVRTAIWDEPHDLAGCAGVLLRSVWDYYQKPVAFRAWLERLERERVRCWNPVPLVRWNMDKHYLRELAARGVPVVPTLWVEQEEARDPARALARVAEAGWPEVVLKPAISGGAWRTHRVRREDLAGQAEVLREVLSESALLAQPFLPEIAAQGEVSLLFFGGAFSHAVLKRPKAGDYRVQWSHGGGQVPFTPGPDLLAQARAVLDAAPEPGLYARVDGVLRDGRLLLMELEQLEPYLFFAEGPGAPERFARALLAQL